PTLLYTLSLHDALPIFGYFLVEYYSRTGKNVEKDQPQKTMEILHKKAPEDQELVLDLAKLYKNHRRFDDAVALLLELAKNVPSQDRKSTRLNSSHVSIS